MRSPLAAALVAALGCTPTTGEPPSSSAGASFCEPGVRDCAPLAGYEVSCVSGTCVARSPAGEMRGDCLGRGAYSNDLASDPLHCGACGRACAAGEACSNSTCRPACPSPRRACGGVCADLDGDDAHCGRCGNACPAGTACRAGACRPSCPSGLTACSGGCVDLRSDGENCGACRQPCRYRDGCYDGRCVSPCAFDPLTATGRTTYAATFEVSPDNCGACDVRCPSDSLCLDGRCVTASPRMKAPLSTAVVTSARPWFRWEPAAGAEGVRIEVCSTRACERVEHRWDVTGDRFRPDVALRGGVHFWRVMARRSGVVSPPGRVVWEFVVPASAAARGEQPAAVVDINGDGLVDRIGPADRASEIAPLTGVEVYLGGPAGLPAAPSQRIPLPDWHFGDYTSAGAWRPTYVGDVNGDGYGDACVMRGERQYGPTIYGEWYRYYPILLYGGPDGVRPTRHFSGDLYSESFVAYALSGPQGDRNGDGYGDAASESSDFAYTSPLLIGGPHAYAASIFPVTYPSIRGGRYHFGDFDADGLTEVVLATQRSTGEAGAPLLLLRSLAGRAWDAPMTADLSGCGVGALTVEQTRSDLRVADVDDDGYDDLLFWLGAGSVHVVFRGGAGGLLSDRCELVP